MKILVTGGTVFVSRYAAEYFVAHGHDVYVLNRNTKPQPSGATPVIADRNDLRDVLKRLRFDAVLDVTAYNANDVNNLLDALGGFGKYVLISSSAVYPEWATQPFTENTATGSNRFWGDYGLGKIDAERALSSRVPDAYIIRPPYIYGEYNNVYRESFMFDCAVRDLPAYIPADENFKLQFIHVEDVCRFAEVLITATPEQRVYNIGSAPVSALEWVRACYDAAGKVARVHTVGNDVEQRGYFPFHAYSYALDCSVAYKLVPPAIGLADGLKRAYAQYCAHSYDIKRKDYLKFINENLRFDE